MKEDEFRELVGWVTDISKKISKLLSPAEAEQYNNVTYFNVIGALLRLLD